MPTPTDALPVRRVGRFAMAPAAVAALASRQTRWTVGLAGAGLALSCTELVRSMPELAVLPLGLAAVAAFPRRALYGLGATALGVAVAVALGPITPGASTLSGWLSTTGGLGAASLHGLQALGAAAAIGLALPWLDDGPRDLTRSIQSALALATTAGVGIWAAAHLVPGDWVAWASTSLACVLVGLLSAQTLVVLALRYHATDRIPSREVIAQTLDEAHRGPALTAWQLDHELDELCPDHDSRDGLGEVATWVYRLQWTRQRLEAECRRVGGPAVTERIVDLSEQAAAAEDDFTRDRLLATVQHLQRLQGHQASLVAERSRAAALAEFATAFLQEARAELTLARVQPGDASPDRLPEVLDRLRTYSADRALARETRREVSALAG